MDVWRRCKPARLAVYARYTRRGGLDINQPMLDRAAIRCPQAQFSLQDMCAFTLEERLDLITCFLYSIHYSASVERLRSRGIAVHIGHDAANLGEAAVVVTNGTSLSISVQPVAFPGLADSGDTCGATTRAFVIFPTGTRS